MDEFPIAANDEDRALARELGRELGRERLAMIEYRRTSTKLTRAEEEGHASNDVERTEELAQLDARRVTWWDLDWLGERDEVAAQALWDRLVREARDELASGTRAAAPFEFDIMPIDRVRFLVLRSAFHKEWRPRGGIEDALVDTLAQSYHAYEYWQRHLHFQSSVEGKRQRGLSKREGGKWEPPTLSVAEAVEQSAAMVERFHRMFLRTVRALRDLRRLPVVVANAGQVNIAEKQVNLME